MSIIPKLINCNTNFSTPLPINSKHSMGYNYNCNPNAKCSAQMQYVLVDNNNNIISSVTVASGVNQLITMPSTAGRYCIVANAICNGDTCKTCKICFTVTCENCNQMEIRPQIPQKIGAIVRLNGFILGVSAANPVVRVSAQLVSFATSGFLLQVPNPNFEFTSTSTIGGTPVTVPFSLTGTRSNIVISNFTAPLTTSILYSLQIDNMGGRKTVTNYRIKLTIFYADGSYCEREIIRNF